MNEKKVVCCSSGEQHTTFFSFIFLDRLTPRPHYAVKFENAALFLPLGLPSTLIRHENRASRKHSSHRRNLKTATLRFRVDGKHFENGAFRKRWRHDNHVISLTESSPKTNPKWPLIVAFSNFFSVVWTENVWFVFRVTTLFSNFSGVVCTGL